MQELREVEMHKETFISMNDQYVKPPIGLPKSRKTIKKKSNGTKCRKTTDENANEATMS